MKKVLALVGIIGLTTFVACGPSKEEQEKAGKEKKSKEQKTILKILIF